MTSSEPDKTYPTLRNTEDQFEELWVPFAGIKESTFLGHTVLIFKVTTLSLKLGLIIKKLPAKSHGGLTPGS